MHDLRIDAESLGLHVILLSVHVLTGIASFDITNVNMHQKTTSAECSEALYFGQDLVHHEWYINVISMATDVTVQ